MRMKTSKTFFAMLAAALAALSVPVRSFAEVGWTSGECVHANWLPASDNVLLSATATDNLSLLRDQRLQEAEDLDAL